MKKVQKALLITAILLASLSLTAWVAEQADNPEQDKETQPYPQLSQQSYQPYPQPEPPVSTNVPEPGDDPIITPDAAVMTKAVAVTEAAKITPTERTKPTNPPTPTY